SECRYRLAGKYVSENRNGDAEALYQALGSYKDSVALLRKLHYDMAEAALTAEDYSTAAQLYGELGKYKDSTDKWKQSVYALAAKELADKQYRKAIEDFTSLGKYEDSETQAESATLSLALELKTSGEMDEALALLKSLPDNASVKDQISEITLGEAMKAQTAGDLEKASELYLALGDYENAKDSYNACQYQLATQKMEAGDYRAAYPMFAALGDYEDAATQSEACEYQAYGVFATPARAAYETKNWKAVVDTLENFDDSNLPAAYKDLEGMYEEACYNYAEELYDEGKVYEALPYYQRIPDYADVTDKKLQRRCYLILGEWESDDGQRSAVFRADGTCSLFGEVLYFSVDGYALKTGPTADELTLTHKLTTLTKTALSIRVLADSRNPVYTLKRVSSETMAELRPEATETPAPSETPQTGNTTAEPAVTAQPAATPTATPAVTNDAGEGGA
ncbi:MAG: hypothetical protein PHY64_11865, partial [Eubacteriales bacterium]|nr:hypothetical protein [Eubacteriales bacterium]